jgi:hypothetical protein
MRNLLKQFCIFPTLWNVKTTIFWHLKHLFIFVLFVPKVACVMFRAQHKNIFLILYLVSQLSKWPQDLLQYDACDFRHIHHLALNEETSKLYIWYELRYDPWYRKNQIFGTSDSVINILPSKLTQWIIRINVCSAKFLLTIHFVLVKQIKLLNYTL